MPEEDIDLTSILSKLEEKPQSIGGEPLVLTGTASIPNIPKEQLKIDKEDVKNLYLFINNFLDKRLPAWKLDNIELENISLLTAKMGEKYGVWLMQYALEGECALFILLYVLARLNFDKEKGKIVLLDNNT